MFSSLVLSLLIQATLTYGDIISVRNGGTWGDWGEWQRCPSGTKARGFRLKVEGRQGLGDDTALNVILLYCAGDGKRDENNPITSKTSQWGGWTGIYWCPSGNLISFILKVEQPQGPREDDTTANNLKMQCSDGTFLEGNGGPWGYYGDWSGSCRNGICGIKTRVESSQGRGDDTALNDVQFECC